MIEIMNLREYHQDGEETYHIDPLTKKFASAIAMSIIYGLIFLIFFIVMVIVIRKTGM